MINQTTLQYALAHADDDVRQLALKGTREEGVDMTAALQQIQGRRKARTKLPSWAGRDDILYPTHLSMEQCSSEATARYKAAIAASLTSRTDVDTVLADITGGFGVDFAFMAPHFRRAVYVERSEELAALVRENCRVLGINADVRCGDGVDFIHRLATGHDDDFLRQKSPGGVTLLYADPARRDSKGGRTYGIGDCTPDVLPLLGEMLAKSRYVMLKLSPMLDWRKAVADAGAQHVEQVHIVSVGGECKELLLLLSKAGTDTPQLICSCDGSIFTCRLDEALASSAALRQTAAPAAGMFLYEPDAALMKAGVFDLIAHRYAVRPLAHNSHLFLSHKQVDDFPGRAFVVTAVSSMSKQSLQKDVLPLQQANITVRNFHLTAAQLRAKLKLRDGGPHYLFGSTLSDARPVIIVCRKSPPLFTLT